ncbi:MAG: hypothetical protein A2428_01035 [Bdellovibrionales bacterium RIFOXYC1_FULL_54_43]|nr:MAG: hypothetical protein A2428_01035 [Bdellovibrionales bacterium RIFOXYC1_FULL_54_43]OFZ82869.1 MAG: hypothetical protein A2603_11760 [Bdellovibrionales bacterium RIFOXYD1_FULL_55_31]
MLLLMAKPELTNSFLLEFSGEHLAYEVENFFACAAELLVPHGNYSLNIRNALLSGFTMHARSILFFLYADKNPKPDDALAQDFLRDGLTWSKIRPDMPESLRLLQRRVGKEIVHLTYSRMEVSESAREWNLGQIICDFVPVFAKFTGNSDRAKLHENVIESGNRWMSVFMRAGLIERVPGPT